MVKELAQIVLLIDDFLVAVNAGVKVANLADQCAFDLRLRLYSQGLPDLITLRREDTCLVRVLLPA